MSYQDTQHYKDYQRTYQREYAHRPKEKKRRKQYELEYRERKGIREHRAKRVLKRYYKVPGVKERMSEQHKEYRENNKDKIKMEMKEYRENNKEYFKKVSKEKALRYLNSWKKIIPSKAPCEICDREVIFDSKIKKTSMYFDHRNGGNEVIKGSPNQFFWSRPATEENIAIFKSCKFGILCCTCNHHLPTKGRIEFLIKALGYSKKDIK